MKKHAFFKKKWFLYAGIFAYVFVSLIISFEIKYANVFYPGVSLNGESVGGKSYDEVLAEFNAKADALLKNGLPLEFQGESAKKEITVPSKVEGLTQDAIVEYFSIQDLQPEILSAYQLGHTGNILQRIKEQSMLVVGAHFELPIFPHKDAIQSLLSRGTRDLFPSAQPAQFSLDKNGKVMINKEKPGENIDIEKITDVVIQKLSGFEDQPLIFNLEPETSNTTAAKLTPFLALAQSFADSVNLNFFYGSHHWKVSGATLITWLAIRPDNQLTVDTAKLNAFLSTSVVPLIDNPPQNSRFQMKDGKLTEISAGTSGNVVNIDKTIGFIEQAMVNIQPKAPITIDVPIEAIKTEPEITQATIDQYHITDLLGTATTNFTGGSLDRQHNIETGVAKMTGMLIAPGEEFSTVNAIGDVTEEAGFVKEYVIDGDQTVKEFGGGLCQVSTTLFRTVLNAGLPVTERINHAYVIPYYGPGLDATIYDPHPDFRFVNDTGNYILLQGTAKNNEVIFELYGVADGRTATVSTPLLSDEKPVPADRNIPSPTLPVGKTTCTTATHKGITADVTYTVAYADGSIKIKDFHSVYQPWPKVCLVGTGPV